MRNGYAKGTDVPAERSRAEIEHILERYGATAFGYVTTTERARIVFEAHGRRVTFLLPMPTAEETGRTATGRRRRNGAVIVAAHEAEIRRRWRALTLAIKAKLEVVANGMASFEEEFLPHVMLPDGRTVGEWAVPQVARAYETGEMPPLLLGAGAA